MMLRNKNNSNQNRHNNNAIINNNNIIIMKYILLIIKIKKNNENISSSLLQTQSISSVKYQTKQMKTSMMHCYQFDMKTCLSTLLHNHQLEGHLFLWKNMETFQKLW